MMMQCPWHVLHKITLHKELFEKYSFNGSFKPSCEQDVISPSLLTLVRMILDGLNIKHQSEVTETTTRAALSISQLLMFNSVKYGRDVDSSHGCHNHDHETPLIYFVCSIEDTCCDSKRNIC